MASSPTPSSTDDAIEFLNVQLYLRKVREEMVKIRTIAGFDLQNFHVLKQDQIHAFENALAEFRRHYRIFAATFGEDIYAFSSLEKDFGTRSEHTLREFTRTWAYAKAGKLQLMYELNSDHLCICPNHAHTLQDRVDVANRLYWVDLRERVGQDPYVEERYRLDDHDIPFLRQNLDEKCIWPLDFGSILTQETAVLLNALGIATSMITTWPENFRKLRDRAVTNGWLDVRVENITTDVTKRILEDGNAADVVCAICRCEYGTNDGDNESAVETGCNHVFGSDCLQTWIDKGNCTCPMCRGQIYPMDTVPEIIRHDCARLERILARMKAKDRLYDQYLRQGNVEIHDALFAYSVNYLVSLVEEGQYLLHRMARKCEKRRQAPGAGPALTPIGEVD